MPQQIYPQYHIPRRIIVSSIVVLLTFILAFALDTRLLVRRYDIDAPEISSPVRIALITDLHSCRYGKGQKNLIEAVRAQDPDLILFGGDIFDDVRGDENTELLLAGIADDFPCYYVTGNHEYWSGAENFAVKMDILQKYGVPVLSGECETIVINGETLSICGVDDPDASMISGHYASLPAQLGAAADAAQNDAFTVLLSHRPEYFDLYQTYDFDLVLSGHAHGGQWRIPGLLNGLFAPDQGLFPKYAGGKYVENDTIMIVSRGLARETTRIPRIFNRPELVIVEIR